jgi:outer membrane protein TolC
LIIGFALPAACLAAEAGRPALTLEEAISRALAASPNLRAARLEAEQKEVLRREAAEAVTFTPVPGQSYSPQFEAAWYGLLSADLNWQMSKKSYAAAEDALVLEVCQKYWAVQGAQEALEVAELALEAAQAELSRVRAFAAVGMASALELEAAETGAAEARAALAAAERALDAAWEDLNRLVGLSLDARPDLVDRPPYQPLEAVSLEGEVSRVLETSPQVWQAEQARTLAEWSLSMAYATGGYEPYEVRRLEQEKAEISALQAREAVDRGVRSLYRTVRSLEEQREQQAREIAAAEKRLRVAEAKFSVGMVTRGEVLAARLELARARAKLADTERQHAYCRLAFQKPWAAGAASAGQS